MAAAPSLARADDVDVCIAAAEKAQELRLDGKLEAARDNLVVCSRAECPAAIRTDCTQWLSEVSGTMAKAAASAGDDGGTADAAPRPPEMSRAPDAALTAWSIGTIGAGGAALGVAAYFWIAGLADHSRLVSTCGATHSCSPSSIDSAHTELVVGDVVGLAGLALVTTGVALLVFGHTSAQGSPAAVLQPVPGGAVLGLRGDLY
jgi:hypothetical protein